VFPALWEAGGGKRLFLQKIQARRLQGGLRHDQRKNRRHHDASCQDLGDVCKSMSGLK